MIGKIGGGGGINGVGKGTSGISGVPAGSRKMVQSLKEIVNYPESEIYATLKDCNMDPNEAVNRLLSQDPFHEVKSKRGKKKESKDTVDSRFHGANNLGNRGGRSGSDRYVGRGGSSRYSSNESGPSHGKPAQKRENGTHAYAGSSSSASGMQGNNVDRQPASHSEVVVAEYKMSTVGSDGFSSLSQPSGYQSACLGVSGQVSMADIVKMGRPQNKASSMPSPPHQSVNNPHLAIPSLAAMHPNLHSAQDHASKVLDVTYEPDIPTNKDVSLSDEWPSIENPSAVSVSSFLEARTESGLYANASNLHLHRSNRCIKSELEEAQQVDDGPVETVNGNHVRSPTSSIDIQEDDSGALSLYDNNLYMDMNSYQSHKHAFEHDEAEDVSSSVAHLQKLNLNNDEQEPPPEEDNPSVIIPNHLQVHTPECSNLSFGSFGPGIGSTFSGTFPSRPIKNNLDKFPEAADASSIGHSDNRNPEYYGDEHLRCNTEGNIMDRSNVSTGIYEAPEDSQPEVLKHHNSEAAQGGQYTFPSSAYSYENSQQLDPAFTHTQKSSQMQNLTPFSNVMQAYTNSLPSTLLTSTVQTAREPDLPYSPFPFTHLTQTNSSISGPTISMPEALRAASISAPQPTAQTVPGATVATGPTLPQHLAMHPFPQLTLPLGHFANMIGYPFLPQSYTYMPSAFQQAFAGNSNYLQSLAAVLPQYKNSVSVSSLPQSAPIPSGYGFGSASIPGGLPLNPPTAPAVRTIGYDDVLSSQYKDSNHLMSLQQNENSAMWIHGPGSRTMSAVPASTYYSFQGQNQQQTGGFRQGQQPSQHFGTLGYPNFYQSQTLVSPDPQQQNPRDGGSMSGSQGQAPKQTQQLWQNNY